MNVPIEGAHSTMMEKFAVARQTLDVIAAVSDQFTASWVAAGGDVTTPVVPRPVPRSDTTKTRTARATASEKRALQYQITQQRAAMRTGKLTAAPPLEDSSGAAAPDHAAAPAIKPAPPSFLLGLVRDELEEALSQYNLAITVCLTSYYLTNDTKYTNEFYRRVTSMGHISAANDVLSKCIYMCLELARYAARPSPVAAAIDEVLGGGVPAPAPVATQQTINELAATQRAAERAYSAEVGRLLEQIDYESCGCGARMDVVPATSQLACPQCGYIDDIIGVAFSDTQLYTQEKTKHSGYDVNRHYRWWIDRIQALESKTFTAEEAARIEYVLDRDGVRRSSLTIATMRAVLKETKLSSHNDHAALLVVQHGGPAPPRLSFQENMRMAQLFGHIMDLYDTATTRIGGNRPYYPYFIYKLIEQEFENKPEKLRLLDYIHLQSRETLIKNDLIYKRICEIDAAENDPPVLVYRPTVRR